MKSKRPLLYLGLGLGLLLAYTAAKAQQSAPAPGAASREASDPPPVTSVPSVDLQRYVGKWYEIASFPMFFQRQCIGDTTAEYAARPDGAISVRNRCRTESGFDEANGKATVVEGYGNGRLKVSFFWPFKADYWVIALDDDYRWALVGHPNRKYLWLLSRTPVLDRKDIDVALSSARAQGFDLSPLKFTDHSVAEPRVPAP